MYYKMKECDTRDAQSTAEIFAIAELTGESVAVTTRKMIEGTLHHVKNEDGTVCLPEDRAGWIGLVY